MSVNFMSGNFRAGHFNWSVKFMSGIFRQPVSDLYCFLPLFCVCCTFIKIYLVSELTKRDGS